VKLIPSDRAPFAFQLDAQEKHLLQQVLGLYPRIPAAHHRLSRSEERPEDQQLLESALAAQRQELQKHVRALLRNKNTFCDQPPGCLLSLKAGEMEWLLQALNDVRVGSWLALGSPDNLPQAGAALTQKTAPHFLAMEIAGHFQMAFLTAMNG
jgi:hypothetical protein